MSAWLHGHITGMLVTWLVTMLMHGCYLEHEAEPCAADGGESSVLPGSSTVEHVTVNHGDAGSTPALAADAGVMPMAGEPAVNRLSPDNGGSNPPTPTVCAGPIVAGECYVDIHDVVSR